MPTVSRSRVIAAIPEHVWDVVADPERLVDWWPRVQRVEEIEPKAWTTVLGSPKGGRSLRADYTLVASEHPRRRSWRHEVAASPFERVLTDSVTDASAVGSRSARSWRSCLGRLVNVSGSASCSYSPCQTWSTR